jgi:cell division protein ZapA (FtsZ GTPase activity inhibitor)
MRGYHLDGIIKINLFGEDFRFKPDEQVENPNEIVAYLERCITDAERLFKSKSSGKNRIAILLLAAMNISKDFHELKLEHSILENNIDDRISSMIKKIEKGFDESKA